MIKQTNNRARVLPDLTKVVVSEGTLLVAFTEAFKRQIDAMNATDGATFNTLCAGVPVIAYKVKAGTMAHGAVSKLVASMGLNEAQSKSAQSALNYAKACVVGAKHGKAIKGCAEARTADEARKVLEAAKLNSFTAVVARFKRPAVKGGKDVGEWIADVFEKYMDLKPGDAASFDAAYAKAKAEYAKAAAEAKAA